jgi:hypothetical protein
MSAILDVRRRHNREVKARAETILKTMKPRCDRGGCDSHSGHEFCSMDLAWDRAVSQAEDEMYDRHRAERDAAETGAA